MLAILLLQNPASAQFDEVEWAKCFGGTSTEAAGTAVLNSIGSCSGSVAYAGSGEYYVVTSSTSSDGIIYGNRGSEDIWLAKLNAAGDTLWSKVIGGSDAERAYKVRALSAGGCVLVGQTLSDNGNFPGNQGINDGFLVKISATGEIVWSKLYGGSSIDFLYDVAETPDGNLVACGDTGSNDGDLTGTGSGLCWILWVNGTNGNVMDSKTYSSPNASNPDFIENFTCITRLSDNSGYVVSGVSSPNFNDFNLDDIFIVKINNTGTQQWSQLVGSTTAGEGSASMIDAGNGEFYMAGRLSGAFEGVTYNGGNGDAWLIKFASDGTLLWNQNYGGTNWDSFTDAVRDTQGNLYLSGFTRSVDNDLTTTTAQGLVDFWMIKTDSDGNLISSRRLGGTENDFGLGIALNEAENEVLIAGRTESNNGDISGNNGGRDLWVVKLSGGGVGVNELLGAENELVVYPNPAKDFLHLVPSKTSAVADRIAIYDNLGMCVYTVENGNLRMIDLSILSPGLYSLCVWYKDVKEPISKSVIKE